jgi:hypothetical protein
MTMVCRPGGSGDEALRRRGLVAKVATRHNGVSITARGRSRRAPAVVIGAVDEPRTTAGVAAC